MKIERIHGQVQVHTKALERVVGDCIEGDTVAGKTRKKSKTENRDRDIV